jgi:hypothetical protein
MHVRARGTFLVVFCLVGCSFGAATLRAQSSDTAKPAPSADDHSAADDAPPSGNAAPSQDASKAALGTTKIRIKVTGNTDKPVGNASVYVRFNTSGGFLRHDKLAEMDLKTNQDGSVKVPEIPQGKVMIQVVAPGWHTFGKWYDIDQAEQTISIQLVPPPHWY